MTYYEISRFWSKRRFTWKKAVIRCSNTSKAAKQFASFVCDEFVNRNNGQFFHKNQTMAKEMNVHTRSIERYISELMEAGWLIKVQSRRRRTLQLSFPDGQAAMAMSKDPQAAPKVSAKTDKSVGLHKNQSTNKIKKSVGQAEPPTSCVIVDEIEQRRLDDWREYVRTKTAIDFDELLVRLRLGSGFQFPSRFPPCDEEANAKARVLRFFEKVGGLA